MGGGSQGQGMLLQVVGPEAAQGLISEMLIRKDSMSVSDGI